MPSIEKASFQELNEMMRKITMRRAQLVTQRAEAAVKQFRSMLKGKGLSMEEVFPLLRTFAPTTKGPAAKSAKPAASPKAATATKSAASARPAATSTKPARKKTKAKAKKKLAPKYVNPKNSKEQWSGHGKRPQWLVRAEKGGVKRESMLIKKPAAKT